VTGCLYSYLTYLLISQWRRDLAINQVGDNRTYLIFSFRLVERRSRQKFSATNTDFAHSLTHLLTHKHMHARTHTYGSKVITVFSSKFFSVRENSCFIFGIFKLKFKSATSKNHSICFLNSLGSDLWPVVWKLTIRTSSLRLKIMRYIYIHTHTHTCNVM
jgi:hypothetical protein